MLHVSHTSKKYLRQLVFIVVILLTCSVVSMSQKGENTFAIGVMGDYKQNKFLDFKTFKTIAPVFFLGLSEGHTHGNNTMFYTTEFFAGPTLIIGSTEPVRQDKFGVNFGVRYSLSKNVKTNYFFQYKMDWIKFKQRYVEHDSAFPDILIEVPSVEETYYLENSITIGGSVELDKGAFAFANAGPAAVLSKIQNTSYDYERFGLEVPEYSFGFGFVAMAGIRMNF